MTNNPVEEVKSKVDLIAEISRFVELTQVGNRYTGFCPFHANVNTPAFYVFPDNSNWYCFGCDEGGDVFNFLERTEGKTFKEVLEELAEKYHVKISTDPAYAAKAQKIKNIQEVNRAAKEYWTNNLIWNMEVMGYLESRGITIETIDRFGLGYAEDSWDNLMNHLLNKGFPIDLIIESGLVKPGTVTSSYYDFFRNRITIPIAMNGGILGFGARIAPGNDSPAKFINTPDTPTFKKREILFGYNFARQSIFKTKTAIVVEGYFDAIILQQYGFLNTVASAGTALTKEHFRALKQAGAERVILAMDGDAAGEKASITIASQAREVDLYICSLPEGKDPDDLAIENLDYLTGLLDTAEPFITYLIRVNTKGEAAPDKKRLTKKIMPMINLIEDPVEQAAYIDQLANALNIKNFRPNPICPHCKKRIYSSEEQNEWKKTA